MYFGGKSVYFGGKSVYFGGKSVYFGGMKHPVNNPLFSWYYKEKSLVFFFYIVYSNIVI